MEFPRIISAKINKQIFPISPRDIDPKVKNYISIVIGNNATGKSRLLVSILNSLRRAQNSRIKSEEDIVHVDLKVDNMSEIPLVQLEHKGTDGSKINLISISNSLYDKFPHSLRSDENYSYVGARNMGLSTHKRAIINDLMDVFSSNLGEDLFFKKAKDLFDFLKLDPVIKIKLKPISRSDKTFRHKELLENIRSPENLRNYLLNVSEQGFFRTQSKKIIKYSEDVAFVQGLYNYLKTDFNRILDKDERKQLYTIDLRGKSKNENFINEYKYFSVLRSLNILTYDFIKLKKGNTEYDIHESSTGEIGLLTTFLRAIPEMKSNSIIFIDEPEISLHPTWQMKYIDLLNNFLNGYSGCHVIIATHSHLLLSDLKSEWSSVLVMSKDANGKIMAELKDHTPFGWSPEAILYDVFGVANVRNHYFEMDVKKLIYLISNKPNQTKEIEKRYSKLKRFILDDDDPINTLLLETKKLMGYD